MMNKDLKDILCAFNAQNVDYLVVGAYAVGVHAEPRATKDLEILIRSSKENSESVFRALSDYGVPLSGLSPADFRDAPGFGLSDRSSPSPHRHFATHRGHRLRRSMEGPS